MENNGSDKSFVELTRSKSNNEEKHCDEKKRIDKLCAKNHKTFNDELDKAFERNEERNSKSDLQKLLKKNTELSLSSMTR